MPILFKHRLLLLATICFGSLLSFSLVAGADNSKIGLVIMHGKGGSPARLVADLAATLESQGFLVANLEMPWSGKREYDVSVAVAEQEIEAALSALRGKGATKLFVIGHSQGGLFALYFANKHAVDGVVAIAPGGSVDTPLFRDKLGDSVTLARKLINEGKGEIKTSLSDYENRKGTYTVNSTPADYLTWFDPDGVINLSKAVQGMPASMPVLYVSPTLDYPGLRKIKQQMFDALPKNPLSALYEPSTDHVGAPTASSKEIAVWTATVASH